MIEIGGKEGALFLGKRVAVDCASYAASYSAGQFAQQKGLDPRINVLLSLGIGIVATKVAGKYILKDSAGNIFAGGNINPKSPMTGEDWYNYFKEKYGPDNVEWVSKPDSININYSKLCDDMGKSCILMDIQFWIPKQLKRQIWIG